MQSQQEYPALAAPRYPELQIRHTLFRLFHILVDYCQGLALVG